MDRSTEVISGREYPAMRSMPITSHMAFLWSNMVIASYGKFVRFYVLHADQFTCEVRMVSCDTYRSLLVSSDRLK